MSTCKSCGSLVKWVKRERWYCENPDGSDHWDLCSQLKFKKIKETGKFFERPDEKGYFTELKPSGVQFIEQHHKAIRGSLYKPSGDCADCCEPWEVCSWPCPDAIGAQGMGNDKR